MSDDAPLIYIIAGEASGDALGGKLMAALKEQMGNQPRFSGIGGEHMFNEGMFPLFPMQELSMMGFAEIVPHIPNLLKRIKQTVEDIEKKQPDLVITIDSPGFTFRVAKQLRKHGIQCPLVHYVAPTVWAYKPERAKKVANLFDYQLCILPFEPPYFEAEGMQASFVGHPVVEGWKDKPQKGTYRIAQGIDDETCLLAVMPGSRVGELKKHLSIFREAVHKLSFVHQNLKVVLPTKPHLLPLIEKHAEKWPVKPHIVTDEVEKRAAMIDSNIALAKSGTISLECALAGLPMITTYRVNPLSYMIAKRIVKTEYVNLINILCEKEVVPELLQEQCRPDLLAKELDSLFKDKHRRATQREAFYAGLKKLGMEEPETASSKAARIVLQLLQA
ncbi:MAG: lipid-A-disaccharide synthase [Rickettsiales bacterium]|nr:lipid-A-disaccharide synthase [Rickettsiales bacterium]